MAKKATITYSWDIAQMNAHIEQFGENNVIFTVHWRYTGISSETQPGTDNHYQASSIGAQSFTYAQGDPFVPYENTEAFEDVVIGWLDDALDVDAMKASLAAQIQKEISPINEDLYFTWQNPPIPPAA
tara:strand:- start:785 stop:1168 length:384 start_codon:yes stop_codon:yes gene_type:complete